MILVDEWHVRLLVGPEGPDAVIQDLIDACDAAVRQAASDIHMRLVRSRPELNIELTVER